jgi:hypothetical protein
VSRAILPQHGDSAGNPGVSSCVVASGGVTTIVRGTQPLGVGEKVRRLLADAPGARARGCGSPLCRGRL